MTKYDQIISELEAYISEMEDHFPELKRAHGEEPGQKEEEPDERPEQDISTQVPKKDAMPKEEKKEEPDPEDNAFTWSGRFVNGDPNVVDGVAKDVTGVPSGLVPDMSVGKAKGTAHYMPYDVTMPYVSVGTARAALSALQSLKQLQADYCPYIICYISDKDEKEIYEAKTLEEARRFVKMQMGLFKEALYADTESETVYIDEGDPKAAKLHEPTDPKLLNDDESYKGPDHNIHEFAGEEHFIIYDETAGSTARWDIYSLEKAHPCVFDPEKEEPVSEEEINKYRKTKQKIKKQKTPKEKIQKAGETFSEKLAYAFKDVF